MATDVVVAPFEPVDAGGFVELVVAVDAVVVAVAAVVVAVDPLSVTVTLSMVTLVLGVPDDDPTASSLVTTSSPLVT